MIHGLVLLLLSAAALNAQSHWRHVPAGATSITALEWRKVLDSPWSAEIRREIPASAAPMLGSVNFIEGIERVIHASSLKWAVLILQGTFDRDRLREMATADGGVSRSYKGVDILLPGEQASGPNLAIVNERTLLIGDAGAVTAAIDGAGQTPLDRSAGADLWVHSAPGGEIESYQFSLSIEPQGLRMNARIRARNAEAASVLAANTAVYDVSTTLTGTDVVVTGRFTREEFARRSGHWRTSLERLQAEPPPRTQSPGKVLIYGLDEGVREVPLGPAR